MDVQKDEKEKACTGDCHKKLAELKDSYDRQKKDLQQAAVFGKSLLDENSQLKADYQRLLNKLDCCAQEKHEYDMKLELSEKSQASVTQENESLRETIQELDKEVELLQAADKEKTRRESSLLSQIDQLKIELAMEKENFSSRYAEMETALANRNSNRRELCIEVDCGHDIEISNLQTKLEAALQGKASADQDLAEARQKVETLQRLEIKLRGQITELETQLDNAERQVTAVNNLLEEKRMENLELQGQLEAERVSCVDPDKRGNSLFGEIEDRRQQAERQLEKVKTLYDVLVKKNQSLQSQNVSLRNEVTLLSFGTSSRDKSEQVAKLNMLVSETKTQNERLLRTVSQLQEEIRENAKKLPPMSVIQGMWVKELMEEHKVELKKLHDRLEDEIRGRICFTERHQEILKRLDETEDQLRQVRGENARYKMQIETLMRNKGQANEEAFPQTQNSASFKVEKLPDTVKVPKELEKENQAMNNNEKTGSKDESVHKRKVRMNPEIHVAIDGATNQPAALNTEEKGVKMKAAPKKSGYRKVETIHVPPPDSAQPECKTQ